ncbi:eukaryotic translation initiation factor NCBP-like [Miscanthus floridulus]|uniref:eukaryotic translation initiation factor NCBP-like n=1 Tax=Miscanthus floridulus TaxID=154761 RepID=UPI003459E553
MEAGVEKKETEQEEEQVPHARKDDALIAAKEDEADSEETEHRNRDLKAGLYPPRDPTNQKGGKWISRFKNAVLGRFWEDLIGKLEASIVDQISFDVLEFMLLKDSDINETMKIRDEAIDKDKHLVD